MINERRFDAARRKVLAARAKRDAHDAALHAKYGPGAQWARYTGAQQRRRQALAAAYDRAADAMFALLADSPRNWLSGVPADWVAETLTYADAVRPESESLTVVPPCAYGFTRPVK